MLRWAAERWPANPPRSLPALAGRLTDPELRGEIAVLLLNTDPAAPVQLRRGDRIAQLIVAPVTHVEIETVQGEAALGGTERGEGGFGSTGV